MISATTEELHSKLYANNPLALQLDNPRMKHFAFYWITAFLVEKKITTTGSFSICQLFHSIFSGTKSSLMTNFVVILWLISQKRLCSDLSILSLPNSDILQPPKIPLLILTCFWLLLPFTNYVAHLFSVFTVCICVVVICMNCSYPIFCCFSLIMFWVFVLAPFCRYYVLFCV